MGTGTKPLCYSAQVRNVAEPARFLIFPLFIQDDRQRVPQTSHPFEAPPLSEFAA